VTYERVGGSMLLSMHEKSFEGFLRFGEMLLRQEHPTSFIFLPDVVPAPPIAAIRLPPVPILL
jgi:hypothetical protein